MNTTTTSPTPRPLHEMDLGELRTEAKTLRAQLQVQRLRRVSRMVESVAGADWVSQYADLLDRYRDGVTLFSPIATPNDRRYGRNFPLFQTEQELALLRAPARILCWTNAYAQGLLGGLQAYVIGTGYTYRAMPRTGSKREPSPELLKTCQAILDEFDHRTEWPEWELELFRRSREDGETFLRHFLTDDGTTDVRSVEPEQVFQPPGETQANWSFGIRTPPGDAQTTEAFWVCYMDNMAEGEVVPKEEIVHTKVNSYRAIKRGLTDFCFDTFEALDTSAKLRRNMGQGAAVTAAIAGIRQHSTASAAQVQQFQQALVDYTQPIFATNGRQANCARIEPGTILDIDKGQEYINPPGSEAAGEGRVSILQACLRGASARWNAPEWLPSADASNNNFASSLTAESPFVLSVLMGQRKYKSRFVRTHEIVLQHAADAGRLPADVLELVEVQCEAPSPQARNTLQEAQEAKIWVSDLAIKSPQTLAQEQGLDFDQEMANRKKFTEQFGPIPGSQPPPGSGGPGGPGGPGTPPAGPGTPPAGAGQPQGPPGQSTPPGSAEGQTVESKDASGHEHGEHGRFARKEERRIVQAAAANRDSITRAQQSENAIHGYPVVHTERPTDSVFHDAHRLAVERMAESVLGEDGKHPTAISFFLTKSGTNTTDIWRKGKSPISIMKDKVTGKVYAANNAHRLELDPTDSYEVNRDKIVRLARNEGVRFRNQTAESRLREGSWADGERLLSESLVEDENGAFWLLEYREGLVAKQITNKLGRKQTVWVRAEQKQGAGPTEKKHGPAKKGRVPAKEKITPEHVRASITELGKGVTPEKVEALGEQMKALTVVQLHGLREEMDLGKKGKDKKADLVQRLSQQIIAKVKGGGQQPAQQAQTATTKKAAPQTIAVSSPTTDSIKAQVKGLVDGSIPFDPAKTEGDIARQINSLPAAERGKLANELGADLRSYLTGAQQVQSLTAKAMEHIQDAAAVRDLPKAPSRGEGLGLGKPPGEAEGIKLRPIKTPETLEDFADEIHDKAKILYREDTTHGTDTAEAFLRAVAEYYDVPFEWQGGIGGAVDDIAHEMKKKLASKGTMALPVLSMDDLKQRVGTGNDFVRQQRLGKILDAMAADAGKVQTGDMATAEPMKGVQIGHMTIKWAGESDAPASLADVFANSPGKLVDATSEVIFTSLRNRNDAYWEKQYNIPDFESNATGGNGTTTIFSGRPIEQGTFDHEGGHNLARKLWGTTTPDPASEYGQAQQAEPPVSTYGANSPSEDFAEACKEYGSPHGRAMLKQHFPRKFAALQKILG